MTPQIEKGMAAAVLSNIGAGVPSNTVTNAHLSRYMDTPPDWVASRTEIGKRRVASGGESTVDLAVNGGNRAVQSAGVAAADAVVLATTSPDRPCPADAPEVLFGDGAGAVVLRADSAEEQPPVLFEEVRLRPFARDGFGS